MILPTVTENVVAFYDRVQTLNESGMKKMTTKVAVELRNESVIFFIVARVSEVASGSSKCFI